MLGIETFLFPVALMLGLSFVYCVILRSVSGRVLPQIAFGLLFGLGAVFAMAVPIQLSDGFVFDVSGILVGVSVVFAGWIAGLIAVVVGMAYRLSLGGADVFAANGVLIASFVLGVFWRGLGPRIPMPSFLRDAWFGMLALLVLMTSPLVSGDPALAQLAQIGLPVLLVHLFAVVVLGFAQRREIAQLRSSEELRLIADIDPLTNLLNRRGASRARARLDGHIGRGQAVLYFDVDRFKAINDAYGHMAGDATLAAVASRIKRVVREQVICSRHGGDEFIIFMTDVSEANVKVVADRLCHRVKETPVSFDGQDIWVSISVGLHWTQENVSYEQMLMQADAALLETKAMGRDRVDMASLPLASQVNAGRWANPSKALH